MSETTERLERLEKFRTEYRAKIANWYSGPVHLFVIYAIGIAALWFFQKHLKDVTVWECLVIPPTMLFCNVMEWVMHMYTMHRPVKGLFTIYERHTLNHHRFFEHDHMTFDTTRDYRIVFFPPLALLTIIVLSTIPALLFNAIWSANAGWLFMMTTTGMYLVYEFFHFCSHLHDNWFLRNLPFVNTIRRHHAAHHNVGIMKDVNMNLTFPVADWMFGTSDLNRGLIGTIFNGYDEKHVRQNLYKNSSGNAISPRDTASSSLNR